MTALLGIIDLIVGIMQPEPITPYSLKYLKMYIVTLICIAVLLGINFK